MEPSGPTLRDAILGGAHATRDWAEHPSGPDRFLSFLRDDTLALSHWFGAAELNRVAGEGGDAGRARFARWLRGAIDRDLARIDMLLSAQLDALLHHPRLLRLEGSWRALARLVAQASVDAPIQLRLLSARWDELARDLERAIEFDQSVFFRMVYESEFGRAGGEPFGLMVLDHEVSHRPPPRAPTGRAPVDDG